jgi:hypothetical protein
MFISVVAKLVADTPWTSLVAVLIWTNPYHVSIRISECLLQEQRCRG